jgi:hypothetical protein
MCPKADNMEQTQVSVKGKQVTVPGLRIDNLDIVITGGWLKTAMVRDEDYVEGDPVADPELLVARLKQRRCAADLFSFTQRVPDIAPRHRYAKYLDNAAVINITSYADWWGGLSQEARRNVRLAAKRGADVRPVPFDDEFVRGIAGIYNETPFRQGRRFWHYGKDLETVRRENGTYAERSEFIGAYCGSELIGFIKMVYVDRIASIMQILSKAAHQDKRPTNALIAKAVELCAARGTTHLLYCKYIYHFEDALTEFKRRNGFVQVLYPRYYVPLSIKGAFAIRTGLHLGARNLLPKRLIAALLALRTKYYRRALAGIERPVQAAEVPSKADRSNPDAWTTPVQ